MAAMEGWVLFRLHFVLTSVLVFPLSAQQYRFDPFTVDGLWTYAQAINNRGAIVGHYTLTRDWGTHAFKRHANGTMERVELYELYYDSLVLNGINNFGEMVGTGAFYERGWSAVYAFEAGGSPRTIKYFGYPSDDVFPEEYGVAINSAGHIVGRLRGDGGPTISYLKIGSDYQEITFPNGDATTVYGIAADDTVVGCGRRGSEFPFLRGPKGNYLELIIPGAQSACALGISDPAGKIVGRFEDIAGKWHGFVYDYLTDLRPTEMAVSAVRNIPVQVVDYPGAVRTEVTGINGKGVIVGWAIMPGKDKAAISFTGTPTL